MSLAYKCDRCEKCFDPYAVEGSDTFITITGLFTQDGKDLSMNKVAYRWDKRHMCPACTSEFLDFWYKGERKEAKTDEGKKTADISAYPRYSSLGDIADNLTSKLRKWNDLLSGFGSNKAPEWESGAEKKGDG